MKFEKEPEEPFYVAVRFARLRDRSIGQKDEVDALLNIMSETEKIMKMTNDAIISLIKKQKPPSTQFIQQTTFDIIVNVQSELAKYVDSKTTRIHKLLDYFRLDGKPVNYESEKLKEFESLWDDLKQEYERVKNEFMQRAVTGYSVATLDDIKVFQTLISTKGIPLMKRLKELEDRILQDILYQIASFTKSNMPMNSNDLYKLLTDEP